MFSYSELIAERSLEEGMEKGMEIGMAQEHAAIMDALRIAKKMYKEGTPIQEIAKNSILSEDELKDILL